MKKHIAILLIIIISLGLCACGDAAPEQTPETPAPEPTEAPAATEAPDPSEAPSTPESAFTPSPEGEVFLTVSSITFSLVGESEDIYIGTAPAGEVSWASDDESIIAVENGVLTAVGVGETTVHAQFNGKTMSCTAGCLAATEEDFNALPEDVRRAPKRLPVHLEAPPTGYFSDALIMGDSISYFLFQFESQTDLLGDVMFLTRGGTSLLGIERGHYNIYYQGQDINIEESVALSGRAKVFLMLGQNDLGYRTIEETLESYKNIINRIREKSPGVEIYIQSLVHEWWETGADNRRNEKIDLYNAQLEPFAEEMGCHYLDIKMYIEDHMGTMAAPYNMDYGIHVNMEGCVEWMHALLSYAYIEMIGDNQ